jgi:hypothetical protein
MSSSWSIFGARAHRANLEIMSLLTIITPGGITTYIEYSSMSKPRLQVQNSRQPMFTNNWTGFDRFPVSWPNSLSLTFSIQCKFAWFTTSWIGYFTTWTSTNGSTSSMQSAYPCLLTTTSHYTICHVRMFLNWIGMRWRKYAGTSLEW